MNLPARQNMPLSPASVDEARVPLMTLFSAYPEPWGDRSATDYQRAVDAKASTYLLAVKGIPKWAVTAAVTDFIQGNVDRPARERGKLPTGEALAVVARKYLQDEASKQAIRKRQDEWMAEVKRAAQAHQAKTPEARENVRRAYQQFLRDMGAAPEAKEQDYREVMRAKYGDALDDVPDAPDAPANFKKLVPGTRG